MDIYCPKCGEPIEYSPECFADFTDKPFAEALALFRRDGCRTLGIRCNPLSDPDMAHKASLVYEVLGDDMDGAAAMLEDI